MAIHAFSGSSYDRGSGAVLSTEKLTRSQLSLVAGHGDVDAEPDHDQASGAAQSLQALW